ncbi:Hypothetical predicted protein [Scomber scombrus]|uniref:Uncharacterized protein n=1 Tax=Scomber scombrus TaxID=13677 RepID=A0AAV1NRJ7_SCOSC
MTVTSQTRARRLAGDEGMPRNSDASLRPTLVRVRLWSSSPDHRAAPGASFIAYAEVSRRLGTAVGPCQCTVAGCGQKQQHTAEQSSMGYPRRVDVMTLPGEADLLRADS